MGDSLILDDGRTLSRSSMSIAGILFLTAEHLPNEHGQLKRWLYDVSDRPNGLASIDLRGLSSQHRTAFHNAARTAFDELERRSNDDSKTPTYDALSDLILMLDSMARGEPPNTIPTDCVQLTSPHTEDIEEIWTTDAEHDPPPENGG